MIIRSSVVELLCSCEERRTCVGFNTVSGYTPLVEVNQAIFAWSFRQLYGNISLIPASGHKLSEVNAKKKQKVFNTLCSQVVTHPSTHKAQCCLTSVIRRELVLST